MEAQLVVDLGVGPPAEHERAETEPQPAQHGPHDSIIPRHGPTESEPAIVLDRELAAAGGGEAAVFRPPVVLQRPPLGPNEAVALEPMERGIQGALVELQYGARHALDVLRDAPPMHVLDAQGLEDHHVDRRLPAFVRAVGHRVSCRWLQERRRQRPTSCKGAAPLRSVAGIDLS